MPQFETSALPRLRKFIQVLPVFEKTFPRSSSSDPIFFPPDGKTAAAIEDMLNERILQRCIDNRLMTDHIAKFAKGIKLISALDLRRLNREALRRIRILIISLDGLQETGGMTREQFHSWFRSELPVHWHEARISLGIYQVPPLDDGNFSIREVLRERLLPGSFTSIETEDQLIEELDDLADKAFIISEEFAEKLAESED